MQWIKYFFFKVSPENPESRKSKIPKFAQIFHLQIFHFIIMYVCLNCFLIGFNFIFQLKFQWNTILKSFLFFFFYQNPGLSRFWVFGDFCFSGFWVFGMVFGILGFWDFRFSGFWAFSGFCPSPAKMWIFDRWWIFLGPISRQGTQNSAI